MRRASAGTDTSNRNSAAAAAAATILTQAWCAGADCVQASLQDALLYLGQARRHLLAGAGFRVLKDLQVTPQRVPASKCIAAMGGL